MANGSKITSGSGGSNAAAAARDKGYSEETKQAVVLFTIVAMFVVCNFIRISLNVYDLIHLEVVPVYLGRLLFARDIHLEFADMTSQLDGSKNTAEFAMLVSPTWEFVKMAQNAQKARNSLKHSDTRMSF